MESNILLIIKQRLLNELDISQNMIENFVNLLESYDEGQYLYYGYFKSQIGISDEQFILITNILIRMGLVEKVFKLYCPNCGEISRTLYYDINEIRTTDICEKCDTELISSDELYKYIVIFFRLVHK